MSGANEPLSSDSFCHFACHLIDFKLENPIFIFRSDYVIVTNHINQKTAELK
jgi:hypothetical protein